MQVPAALQGLTDQQLNRAIRRLAFILAIGAIAFFAFYAIDRWRAPSTPIIDQRVTALEQAVRDNPNDVAVRGQLADTYLAKSRFQDAIAQYDVIIAAGTYLEPAHLGKARALVGLERLDEAIPEFEAVVEVGKGGEMAVADQNLAAAYYGLGSIAMKQSRPADAVGYLEKALAITRSDADSLYLIGTAYVAAGQTDNAILAFRSAIDFVPVGWSEPYTALGAAYDTAGKPALAAWARAMASLATGNGTAAETELKNLVDGEAAVDAAVGLGVLYEMRGDAATAADWYTKALASDGTNAAARLGLSRVRAVPTAGAPTPPAASPAAVSGEGAN